jgi:hypothetical protein
MAGAWLYGGRAWLYCMKSEVILLEERGYIARSARLYCWKSAVILPEERGYIAGRTRLYFCMEIVAYISCSAGCTHFAWTKITKRCRHSVHVTATVLHIFLKGEACSICSFVC